MDISPTSSASSSLGACNNCRDAQGGPQSAKDKEPGQKLSEEEQKQVDELKARDREVRAHEAAHLAAAGGHANGGANFTYQRGPDGRSYAVGGEVSIDTSKVAGDPEATLAKAQQIQRAALAPAEPSPQDRQVAAEAAAMATEARQEIARENDEAQEAESGQDKNTEQTNELLQRFEADGALTAQNPGLHLIA